MKQLRSGYTTGACAAAGVKAALLYEQGEDWDSIELRALDGTELLIPIKNIVKDERGITAEVVKFSGDDPDITNGVSVFTTIRHLEAAPTEIVFKAGEGIGTVTKPGLSVPVGEPSINPGPRQLIRNVVAEVLGTDKIPLEVTISIPAGVDLAKQTLNPILGVEGGISVIGTTGVLRPMSEEGFKNSLVPQIDVAKAAGFDVLIFVPGKIGERLAGKWQLPAQAMVQTSNFIGFMLEAAQQREIKRVLLFGHIGKLIKVAAGCFYTHNRIADGRLETMAAYGAAEGLSTSDVQAVLSANTTEDALAVLERANLKSRVCQRLAERASLRAERYLFQKMQVGTVMVTMTGELLGMDETAKEICKELGGEVPVGNAE
ncbi:cobalt-precorrin-5B (C(1))-methyltransferase CbiD [Selenomonas ruminantium]|uniref:Cobalt-precorrin-5B C(1)-methyltransferase n=1 Tax=Selenomonas ruminantium TaxID=971 RepID=A0A1H3Y2P1_SELRU|nr:cobalt-precorrin-5B (C(1))-methyltransferase CbiD [Selenomonas ruminantium]SEA05997.1 cobalt-precorrin-5B (C1)-methyltransferase [Selenomonas ruminantium]